MKFLILALVFSFTASAFALEHEMFDKVKAHALSNIEKRQGYLNDLKSCVSSATDKNAIKTCRDTHRAQVKALKDGNESFKSTMKSERQAKRDARKKQ
jgi:hypothetical protein